MNTLTARRFCLTWRSHIASGAGLVVFMAAMVLLAQIVGRVVVEACQ